MFIWTLYIYNGTSRLPWIVLPFFTVSVYFTRDTRLVEVYDLLSSYVICFSTSFLLVQTSCLIVSYVYVIKPYVIFSLFVLFFVLLFSSFLLSDQQKFLRPSLLKSHLWYNFTLMCEGYKEIKYNQNLLIGRVLEK